MTSNGSETDAVSDVSGDGVTASNNAGQSNTACEGATVQVGVGKSSIQPPANKKKPANEPGETRFPIASPEDGDQFFGPDVVHTQDADNESSESEYFPIVSPGTYLGPDVA